MFKKYESNIIGKDYVVGDIHGCYSDLEEKLKEISFNPEIDRLFSVGDLTDRGPESDRAFEFLDNPWFFPIRGNHEDMILKCWKDHSENTMWHTHQNGGDWILAKTDEWKEQYIHKILSLPLVIQVGDYGIVHSMIPVNNWNELIENIIEYSYSILWQRNSFSNEKIIEGITGVFSGHTINKEITCYGNNLDLDTGAFLKYWEGEEGKLSIIEICHENK